MPQNPSPLLKSKESTRTKSALFLPVSCYCPEALSARTSAQYLIAIWSKCKRIASLSFWGSHTATQYQIRIPAQAKSDVASTDHKTLSQ